MVWTLLKKQCLSALSFFTMGKNGKKRSPKVIAAFAVLILYAVGSMGLLYWQMADMLCEPLLSLGMAWVYFAMMGTMATALGVILGIFIAKTRLYEAKDNDLLLSMPIPSWVILLSRTVGLYLFTLFIEGIVFIPAILRYFTIVGFSLLPVVCSVAVMILLPFLALALFFMLGWVIAFISAKIPGKNTLEVLFSVAFLVGYFNRCYKAI
jgi:ABC-2 type transport system permease protein